LLPRLRRLQPLARANGSDHGQFKERLGLKQFVGESPALTEAIMLIPKLARSDASVFITGETGTGKEMFARALHYLSSRSGRPFIPVNCGAIPAELVENELFGHERGAFTGASATTRGLIHEADGGTLFLDEIDCLPLQTQVKLLRFLQDRTYRPLGSRQLCEANLRIVAASNARIEEAIQAGKFRSDLYYRINVLTLKLPPLRERKEDIPLLAEHFIAKFSREADLSATRISPAALQKLLCHDWPGNVRELENVIQRAVVLSEQHAIRSEDIVLPAAPDILELASFKALKSRVVLNFEKNYLQRMLADHQGNITRAAKAASKDRRAFWQLLRKHKLHVHPPPNGHRRPDNPRVQ
jgi:DNA-binding NtrC family response regulator